MSLFKSIILATAIAAVFVNNAIAQHANCLKVKIFSSSKTINFTDRQRFVLHFQLENCSNYDFPIDFYANIGYPTDSSSNIYFEVSRAENNSDTYSPYPYNALDYKNLVDSIIQLKPHKIYTFYLPLFQLYELHKPGKYRLQGFYRFKTERGDYFIQPSDYYYIVVK